MDKDAELDKTADRLIDAALNGDSEALKALVRSGTLDDAIEAESASHDESEQRPIDFIRQNREEDERTTAARALLSPTTQAAISTYSLLSLGPSIADSEADLAGLVEVLNNQVQATSARDTGPGVQTLAAQAQTLDALFHALMRRALKNMGQHLGATETFMKLGLRAQSQCRSTLEAISAIQNPPVAGYVKQANIAQNQQVNNDSQVNNGSRTRENENPQTELLEETTDEQWMDRGTEAAPEGAYSEVETVGEVDGAEDTSRKDQVL